MKKKFEKLMVLFVVLVAGMTAGIASGELVAYYSFNDGTAADISGNGHHGTLVGNNVNIVTDLERGKVLELNNEGLSVNSCVDCGGTRDWAMAKVQLTIAGWIKIDNLHIYDMYILTKGDSYQVTSNGLSDGLRVYMARLSDTDINTLTTVNDGNWHHFAVTYDSVAEKRELYIDGLRVAIDTPSGLLRGHPDSLIIGGRKNERHDDRGFDGWIDDVAIFNHAVRAADIEQLYRYNLQLSALINALQETKTVAKEQKVSRRVTFLDKKIVELEELRDKVPNEPASLNKQGSILLWLYENTNPEEYEDVIGFLLRNNSNYLVVIATKAEAMVREQESRAAIKFLEGNLKAYTHWRENHPLDDMVAEDILPEIYFKLAKAKEAVGAPKKDIAGAYSKTFNPSRFDYIRERTAALAWLLENGRTDEYIKVIKSFTQSHGAKEPFTKVVSNVSKYFESKRDWPKFKQFLDAVFEKVKYPIDWVILIDSCLSDKENQWAKQYFNYLGGKPGLKFHGDFVVAEEYAARENFEKAADLYQGILKRCGSEDSKIMYEFRLCECLFKGGEYREAISKLESFITNYKTTNRNIVKEAMLIKGRTHIQLGELDKAMDSFFALMVEYPDAKEIPETNYFVGYCYMLQSRFKEATEAFNAIVKAHPNNPYAGRAQMLITRIKNMTK